MLSRNRNQDKHFRNRNYFWNWNKSSDDICTESTIKFAMENQNILLIINTTNKLINTINKLINTTNKVINTKYFKYFALWITVRTNLVLNFD